MSRLEQALVSMPGSVDWPEPSPHMAARITARLEGETSRRSTSRWIWVTAIVLVAVTLTIPGPRQAVADLIVEAGVRIGVIEEAPTAGAGLELGEEASLEEANAAVDFAVSVPSDPGPPDAIYLDSESVSMVWPGSSSLPAAPETDVGVLLTQTRSGDTRAFKGLTPETDLTELTVSEGGAVWIEGAEHTFTLVDPAGNPIEETSRLAANVLLWTTGDVDYRLELAGELDDALAIANSLEVR